MQRRLFGRMFLREPTLQPSPHLKFSTFGHCLGNEEAPYNDVPKPSLPGSRKPYPTPMKVLIRRAKEERIARKENPLRIHEPPDNGLLVPELVEVSHYVNKARLTLLNGLSKLVNDVIPVKRCRFCREVHVGQLGHEIRSCLGAKSGSRSAKHMWIKGGVGDVVFFPHCFHLHDRVGKPRITHKERTQVQRLPAILELCIQAGLDIEEFPTVRRTKPVYSIEGRIVDFEPLNEGPMARAESLSIYHSGAENETILSSREVATETMESWFKMRKGAELMMKQYGVLTCGYCPEVQVGPKGHKVRMCKASKHQARDGLHAWQEATIDELIGPNYVWHVKNPGQPSLYNEMKRYYGKTPAIVELCVQAGAPIPKKYQSMMRVDVVSPDRDEFDLVA